MTTLITIHSQKGGSAKSTLAANLYIACMQDGIPSAILDLDPQASITQRFDKRTQTIMDLSYGDVPRTMSIDKVFDQVKKTHKEIIFLDTEPRSTERYQELACFSDLIVVPVRPTVVDLEAVGNTYAILKNAGSLDRTVFVITQAASKRGMCENPDVIEAQAVLEQYGLTLAPTIIRNRLDYSRSLNDGRGVLEASPHSKAADEIRGLWNTIKERI
ncbi:AAA family ATPase [Magnetovibrio sp. PR-2]|uniref:AAA family ATPase n=1 Tax=Magnetovibrio sp. PR-2 TaxID=3120356 RepID=UPI002FCDE2BB